MDKELVKQEEKLMVNLACDILEVFHGHLHYENDIENNYLRERLGDAMGVISGEQKASRHPSEREY